MSKQLQVSISIAILLIAGCVVYYFFSYLPQQNLQANIIRCKTLSDAYVNNQNSQTKNFYYSEDQTHYNTKLKTCLLEEGVISNLAGGLTGHEILDLYTNKNIIGWGVLPPSMQTTEQEQLLHSDFNKQEAILMSQ